MLSNTKQLAEDVITHEEAKVLEHAAQYGQPPASADRSLIMNLILNGYLLARKFSSTRVLQVSPRGMWAIRDRIKKDVTS